MAKKNDLEHTSTMLGNQDMKGSQRMVSVVEPYELPEGWKWVQQNEVCKLTDGEKRTGTEFPYLEVKYLRGKKEKDFVSTGKFIKAGTKVILVDGENSGEVFTVPEDGFMGSTFRALEISNVNENYLQYFIHTKKDLYRNNKKGSAIPHLDKKLFFTIPFPLPPTLAEQQRIVNRIESMFAKLDKAKEKAQNVVDSFETRKAAILHKAFTNKLKIENGKLKDEEWKERKLGEICEVTSSKRVYQTEQTSSGIPFLRIADIMCKIQNKDVFPELFISAERYKKLQSQNLVPKENEILVTSRGTLGKCYLIKKDDMFYFQDGMISWLKNIDRNISSQYLIYLFQSKEITNQIEEMQNGSTVNYLSISMLKKISIPIPPFNYQLSIVNFLDSVLEKENKAKQAAEAVLEQIDLLKKSILARAFRGEL